MGDPAESTSLRLSVLEHRLAVCRLEPDSEIPAWATGAPFFCVTRTAGELSVVCPEGRIPAGTTCETDYVLVRKSQLDLAAQTLRERGHEVHEP